MNPDIADIWALGSGGGLPRRVSAGEIYRFGAALPAAGKRDLPASGEARVHEIEVCLGGARASSRGTLVPCAENPHMTQARGDAAWRCCWEAGEYRRGDLYTMPGGESNVVACNLVGMKGGTMLLRKCVSADDVAEMNKWKKLNNVDVGEGRAQISWPQCAHRGVPAWHGAVIEETTRRSRPRWSDHRLGRNRTKMSRTLAS